MKNRRSIIVAFLVVAMLVTGIGYAAISDNLMMAGSIRYKTPTEVQSQVDASVHFDTSYTPQITRKYKNAANDDDSTAKTATDDIIHVDYAYGSESDQVDSNIVINGIATVGGVTVQHYHVTVIYKVVYDNLVGGPDVILDIVTASMDSQDAIDKGFTFAAKIYEDLQCTTEITKMSPNSEAYIKAEYIYNMPANMTDDEVAGTYGFKMTVSTPDAAN